MSRRPSPLLLAIGIVAAAVWVASSAISLSSGSYLTCTDGHGHQLGGMDCFGQPDVAHVFTSEPARSIGYDALLYSWLGASAVLCGCGAAAIVRRRRRRASRAPGRAGSGPREPESAR